MLMARKLLKNEKGFGEPAVNRRVAMVTGGSRGIGRGISLALARAGYDLAICSRNLDCKSELEAEFEEYGLTRPLCLQADVAKHSSLTSAVTAVTDHFGGLDILCANAGVFPSARLDEMTPESLDHVFSVNIKGTIYSLQAALSSLKQSVCGRVIITSSVTGPITGFPGWSHYGASKAAQLGFMRSAALELAPFGITVNAILPGNILTEGLAAMGSEYVSGMAKSIPLGRLGSVEDIGALAVFLASEAAGYITGQGFVVDGGQTLPESLEGMDG